MSNVLNILNKAILTGHVAAIRYDNQHHVRVIEPHVIYISKDGIIRVDCYQTKGQKDAGEDKPRWKTYQLMNIDSIFLLNETFEARIDVGFTPTKQEYKGGLIAMISIPGKSGVGALADLLASQDSQDNTATKQNS